MEIGQMKAKNDPGYGLAKGCDIISLIKEMEPANQCGRNVKAYRTTNIYVPAQ